MGKMIGVNFENPANPDTPENPYTPIFLTYTYITPIYFHKTKII